LRPSFPPSFNFFGGFLLYSQSQGTCLLSYLVVISGPDRRIFLPEGLLDRSEIPEYLTGEVPGE
ncbi:hypothetical protein, partial [Shigella flexneri]|uniref:hypothetical protein n=1 Tax=Shigella flexneri TaxID=623 RepID=UPI001C0A6EF6